MITKVPVLFLIFNRPSETKIVFDAIKKSKPTQLFIAADGPRENVKGEKELCNMTREITENINWPCKVKRLYRKNNLGCKKAVSGAMRWFFKNVEEGIILEDDCLPDLSFFKYCEELIVKYRHNKSIGIIGGNNFSGNSTTKDSYYFSLFSQMWGWATWRRVWKNYDIKMRKWPDLNRRNWLNTLFPELTQVIYWWSIFDSTYRGKVDTWDYQWVFSSWVKGYLNIVPRVNLVKNIGFGNQATHLKEKRVEHNQKINKITFPLRYPNKIERNFKADNLEEKHLYNYVNLYIRLKWYLTEFLMFRGAK